MMNTFLSTDINAYLEILINKISGIKEVWLIGSRANGNYRPNSDWDFFIFTDEDAFSRIKVAREFKKHNIDLLVVYNGDDFEEPWPEISATRHNPKNGSLFSVAGWKWNVLSEKEATYKATKELPDGSVDVKTKRAIRIYP